MIYIFPHGDWKNEGSLAYPLFDPQVFPPWHFHITLEFKITTLKTKSVIGCHRVWVVLWLVLGVQVGSTELLLLEHAKAIPRC